ncbi:unnamed protein product [marine sediment metagenome]|uniref:Uncharacterized protein n=1 Tax=marine sediment metagenome TaxID=412755 RepID=X1J102_9ZZZZ
MYRAEISGTGIAPYGDGEIAHECSSEDLRDVIADVERWVAEHVCDGGNRPAVTYTDDDETVDQQEIEHVAQGMSWED